MADDLADLFKGFDARWVEVDDVRLFARVGGEGPPLVLLHGYPQTHVMWHHLAPDLARHFTVVIPDLRGYGWSSVPESDPEHRAYSKRAMAADIVALMEKLGHVRFSAAGHDRGARVLYRLALDHPGRLHRLALLDIVPTHAMWSAWDAHRAMRTYHWTFLAQPAPLPEMLIEKAPLEFLEWTLASWTKAKSLEAFDARALNHYRAFFDNPDRIHATCEDYRAGQGIDLAIDTADVAAERRISIPLLVLWGGGGFPADGEAPLEVWRRWASDVRGEAIDSGHFLAEENPSATSAALLPFLKDG